MQKLQLVIIFMLLLACNNNSKIYLNVYNSWLKDTIRILERDEYKGYKRSIFVSQDSTTLEIDKTFDTIFGNKNINSKEVLYAIELLKQNNKLPNSSFELNLKIRQVYSMPVIKRLKYDYSYEFLKFNVKYGDTIYQYDFIKGKLVD